MSSSCAFANGFQNQNSECKRSNGEEEVNYCTYLQLDRLLSAQKLRSEEFNQPAHHEHLFIITHQVYELWFKQILFELDSCKKFFLNHEQYEIYPLPEVVKRMSRVVRILRLLIDQLAILETMTASDFIEFRNFLTPASGFQSLQFRLIENKLGMKQERRVGFQRDYSKQFLSNEKAYCKLKESLEETSLFSMTEKWLEEWPFGKINFVKFLELYREGIERYTKDLGVTTKGSICENQKIKKKEVDYDFLFSAENFESLMEANGRKFSYKAFLGAIIVALYNQEPVFSTAYQIINLLIELDSYLLKWRHNHMLMVQKMIGYGNTGTGGSSGYQYLKSTLSDHYNVFADLANISMYLIPQRFVPAFSSIRVTS